MVKRLGNLMSRITHLENLYEAFLRAAKGKSSKQTVIAFRNRLDENLQEMSRQLQDGEFRFGQYHFFTIYDPKRRIICAASFPERVAFHAIMRICHPVFDDYQIFDSYASRIGKGTYKALERAKTFARQYKWFAKLDVRKYFDSISHEVLLSQLCRLFKDKQLLLYFRDLLDSYETDEGRGLPIGNLTSQYFANHYLSVADHYIKEQLRVSAMVRYMDDVLLFDNDKNQMKLHVKSVTEFVKNQLRLELHDPIINATRYGIPFLGYVVYPDCLRLNARSRKRFQCKMNKLNYMIQNGIISQQLYAERATCLFAFIRKADVYNFQRQSIINGTYPLGL